MTERLDVGLDSSDANSHVMKPFHVATRSEFYLMMVKLKNSGFYLVLDTKWHS